MADKKNPGDFAGGENPFPHSIGESKPEEQEARAALLEIAKPQSFNLFQFFRKDSLPNLILVLTVICVAAAMLLAGVYRMTEPRIREERERSVQEALGVVFPVTLSFSPSPYHENVFEGRDANGSLAGFSVRVSPVGYGGNIDMIVGVSLGCEVSGVAIVSHRETKGYGTKVLTEPWFLDQFTGLSESIELGKAVDGISGATRSSAAVTEGVREAVDIVLQLLQKDSGEAETP